MPTARNEEIKLLLRSPRQPLSPLQAGAGQPESCLQAEGDDPVPLRHAAVPSPPQEPVPSHNFIFVGYTPSALPSPPEEAAEYAHDNRTRRAFPGEELPDLICWTSEHASARPPFPPSSQLPPNKRPKRSSASPPRSRALTGAASAVFPQLVIVPAAAPVLRQRHLHAVVFTAAVVQGARVHSYEARRQSGHGTSSGTGTGLSHGANRARLRRALLVRTENGGVLNLR